MNARDQRRRQLAEIHIKAKHLDRDTYVALLQRVAGVRSSADLDGPGLVAVVDELRRLAGESKQQMRNALSLPDAPQNVREELAKMVAKVGAILAERGKPWKYAHATAKRMFRVARVEWLTPGQLHRLVAALSYNQRRNARAIK